MGNDMASAHQTYHLYGRGRVDHIINPRQRYQQFCPTLPRLPIWFPTRLPNSHVTRLRHAGSYKITALLLVHREY